MIIQLTLLTHILTRRNKASANGALNHNNYLQNLTEPRILPRINGLPRSWQKNRKAQKVNYSFAAAIKHTVLTITQLLLTHSFTQYTS